VERNSAQPGAADGAPGADGAEGAAGDKAADEDIVDAEIIDEDEAKK
jgi:molecular chaperone DnaK